MSTPANSLRTIVPWKVSSTSRVSNQSEWGSAAWKATLRDGPKPRHESSKENLPQRHNRMPAGPPRRCRRCCPCLPTSNSRSGRQASAPAGATWRTRSARSSPTPPSGFVDQNRGHGNAEGLPLARRRPECHHQSVVWVMATTDCKGKNLTTRGNEFWAERFEQFPAA